MPMAKSTARLSSALPQREGIPRDANERGLCAAEILAARREPRRSGGGHLDRPHTSLPVNTQQLQIQGCTG